MKALCTLLAFSFALFGSESDEIASLSIAHEFDKEIDITNGGILFEQNPLVFHPKSSEEIGQIIALAARHGRKIRVIGSMHSLNPCALSFDYLIALDQMKRVLEIGSDYCIAEGGISIRELCTALEKRGLTLSVLGSIAEQTITGAISTGTRGQVPAEGSLGSLVTHIEIIDGLGRLKNLTLEDNFEELNGSITSLGLMGVITKVTLKCKPLFLMTELIRRLSMDEVIAQMDRLADYEKWVLYWNVDAEEVKVVTGHRVKTDLPPDEIGRFATLGIYPHLHSMEGFPDTIQRVGKSWDIITLLEWTDAKSARRVRNMKLEQEGIFQGDYSIPKEQFVPLLDDIRKFFRENRHRLRLSKDRMVVEIRPVKKDSVWLSPSFGRDSISLCFHDFARGLKWSKEDAGDFLELEQILKKYDVRPHLGKAHFFSSEELGKAFPRWNDFKALREQNDPENVFLTPYLFHLLE